MAIVFVLTLFTTLGLWCDTSAITFDTLIKESLTLRRQQAEQKLPKSAQLVLIKAECIYSNQKKCHSYQQRQPRLNLLYDVLVRRLPNKSAKIYVRSNTILCYVHTDIVVAQCDLFMCMLCVCFFFSLSLRMIKYLCVSV